MMDEGRGPHYLLTLLKSFFHFLFTKHREGPYRNMQQTIRSFRRWWNISCFFAMHLKKVEVKDLAAAATLCTFTFLWIFQITYFPCTIRESLLWAFGFGRVKMLSFYFRWILFSTCVVCSFTCENRTVAVFFARKKYRTWEICRLSYTMF
jgi:hypothetical protein